MNEQIEDLLIALEKFKASQVEYNKKSPIGFIIAAVEFLIELVRSLFDIPGNEKP